MRFYCDFNVDQLNCEYLRWITKFGHGRDKNDLRFGQYLCNRYLRGDVTFSELYYVESAAEAYTLAMQEFTPWQE